MILPQALPNVSLATTQVAADCTLSVTTRDGPERIGTVLVVTSDVGYIEENHTLRRFGTSPKLIGPALFGALTVGRCVKFFHNGHNCAIDVTLM